MTATYEIKVDGQHAATVTVKDPIELCSIVATIRRVWDTPMDSGICECGEEAYSNCICSGCGQHVDPIYPDVDEGGVEITSTIVRMR